MRFVSYRVRGSLALEFSSGFEKYRLSWGCGRSDVLAVERRVWAVVWNLKDVEEVEMAFPALVYSGCEIHATRHLG